MIHFYLASTDDDYSAAKRLFKEYADSLEINLDFQHFDDELAGLKNMYAKPYGGVILAKDGDEIFGCIAVRKINETIGELKRMYIRPAHQRKGIGKVLLETALELARSCNYTTVRLDTLNNMLSAIHLYKQAGFYEIPPYYFNPVTTAVYFEKEL